MIADITQTQLYIDQENTYTSGVFSKRPVVIARGQGAILWDVDGNEYIDCMSGSGVANLGHGRADIAAVLATQAQRLITCSENVYNDVRSRYLARLAAVVPAGIERFFLCNSGTEAVEGALKFARLATERTDIVATMRGFHGRTMGALSATWDRHYREPFAPLVPGVTHVRYNDLAAMEAALTERTAAVLVELVQGEGGVHPATQEYIRGLADLCRERDVLLIVDEIQTGFGRTGTLFACEQYNVQPDILCLAKSIAGGLPMGAVCLGQRVVASGRISKGVHGSTFGGNPLACAVALETLDIMEREQLPARATQLGSRALERLRAMQSPLIKEVRGLGLMIGIELRTRAQQYLEALLERGILALPAGPNVLRLLPPLVITEEQLERVLDTIEDILSEGHSSSSASSTSSTVTSQAVEAVVPGTEETALLHQMLTIPSLSRQEGTLARFLVEQAQRMGLDAHLDEAGNAIAVAAPQGEAAQAAPIVLLGHMDTVGGNIPVRLQDGILYGRGAVDAKGPLAAFFCAAARLVHSGELQRPIVVIGAVEEEAATSRGARAVVDRYRPVACVIGEPSSSKAITIGYKGRLLLDCRVMRSLSHSAGPQQTASEAAAHFWQRIRTHAASWNEAHAGNSAFAALMPSLRSITSEQDGLTEQTRLSIGYRLPPDYDISELRSQLESWAQEDGVTLSFSGEEVAFQAPRTSDLARAFVQAIRATGEQPSFKLKTGTSDMNVVGPVWGQNIVAYGPGDSRLDHTPDEHIHIAEYLHAIDVLERVLRTLAQ